ncbi:MAG: ABC transporter substrate binding protein [Candidatus Entotheonellia bacterium]
MEAGGLISYGPNRPEMVRWAATFVDKLLKGATPANLPIEQLSEFDLLIHLNTVQAVSLTVPPTPAHGGRGDPMSQPSLASRISRLKRPVG